MASKKYRDKLCVYCVERKSTTADHVFCREFFLTEHRNNLPKAPACAECNGRKSALEHYLTAVLPFGGRHTHASVQLETMVPGRVEKNQALLRQLQAGQRPALEMQGGILLPTSTLPFHGESLESLFSMVVRGLIWHHFSVYLPAEYFVKVFMATPEGEQAFDRNIFALNTPNRVHGNLGDGTFIYEGVQVVDTPASTGWRITAMGGVRLGGDRRMPNAVTSKIIGFSAHRRILDAESRKLLFGGAVPPPVAA